MISDVAAEAADILRRGEVISGLADCHVRGVFSLVLRPRKDEKEGMLRVFYAGPGSPLGWLETNGDFVVMPHNHRQAITLYHLFGEAWNVHMDKVLGAETVYEYAFGSALLDRKFTLDYRQTLSRVRFFQEKIESSGNPMHWWHVHTVVAMPGSAWVVKEGELAPEPFTALAYSRRPGKTLDSSGLYRPLSQTALEAVVRIMLRRI